MKKTFLLTIMAIVFVWKAQAQTQAQQRINDIKRQADRFVYADVTMPLSADAVQEATRQLTLVVEEWLHSEGRRKVRPGQVAAIARQADTISTPRADMVRVFAFMAKERVERMLKNPSLIVSEAPRPARNDLSVPAPSAASADFVAVEDTYTPTSDVAVEGSAVADSTTREPVAEALRRILAVSSFFDLKAIIVPLKEQGVVEDYGKYETMTEPDRCYLIVYDTNGRVVAVLAPLGTERVNMKTEAPDNEHNYPGCGAIWVKFSEQES